MRELKVEVCILTVVLLLISYVDLVSISLCGTKAYISRHFFLRELLIGTTLLIFCTGENLFCRPFRIGGVKIDV